MKMTQSRLGRILRDTRPGLAWRVMILAAVFALMQWYALDRLMAKEPTMEVQQMTIWQWIEEVPRHIPFTRAKMASLLQSPIEAGDNSSNKALDRWTGGKSQLAGGVEMQNVDLRIRRDGPDAGFLVVDLTGSCTTLPALRSRYADLRLTD